MNVANILESKTRNQNVHMIGESATVSDAVQIMNKRKIGALPVTDSDSHVVGMFTERDVLTRVVAKHRDPQTTRIRDVMTKRIACCDPTDTIEHARSIMRSKRIRHLPVISNDNKLAGIISIGDLNANALRTEQIEIEYMHEYIHGRT